MDINPAVENLQSKKKRPRTLLQRPDLATMRNAGFFWRGVLIHERLDEFIRLDEIIQRNPGTEYFICPFFTLFGITKIEVWSRPAS